MSAVAAFVAVVFARAVLEEVGPIILRERETIAQCVKNFRVPRGPRLDLSSCLRDVADANRALADPAVDVRPRPGWRYRCTLVYRAGLGQAAFFRALRIGPRVAALVGSVDVDVEEVPERRTARDEGGVSTANDDDADDDDGFEHVAACRRMTLAEFYTMLRPALSQIAVDRVPAEALSASQELPPSAAPPARDTATHHAFADDDDDDQCCAICMDAPHEVVTRCAHAYCEECYLRWLSISRECPLCRDPLGVDMRGSNVGSYAMVGPGDLLERQASGGRVDGRGGRDDDDDGDENAHRDGDGTPAARMDAEWLRGRLGDLPVVAEADARRARFAAMFARLKRAEEAERG